MNSVIIKTVFEQAEDWIEAPQKLNLLENQVHIWWVTLKAASHQFVQLRRWLSQDELERAQRYRFARDRDWFIIRRGTLRLILGGYLSVAPAQIAFTYNSYGKPSLVIQHAAEKLYFNQSHSRGEALFAFSRRSEVGVDIEHVRPEVELLQIAARYFSPQEKTALQALPEHQRYAGFFACWTRKEAIIKASGQGLSLPLHDFDVSLKPGEPARLLATRGDLRGAKQWSLYHLELDTGVIGALAIRGQEWELVRYRREGWLNCALAEWK